MTENQELPPLKKPTKHPQEVEGYIKRGAPEELARTIVAKDLWFNRVAKTKAEYKKAAETSMVDPLTGAFNRQYFDRQLEDAFQHTNRQHRDGLPTEIGIILFDLDRFKKINDTFGHIEGDEVLKRFVATMSSTIREEDVLARWGGEEFALLLRGSHELKTEEIKDMVKRFHEVIQANVFASGPEGPKQPVTASMGLAFFNGIDNSKPIKQPTDLILFADKAMYKAKAAGRNQAWVFGNLGASVRSPSQFNKITPEE